MTEAEIQSLLARLSVAEARAERYRKIILQDAGAPDDADNICCCGGKLGQAGYGWPCSHGGCRSMADYYLSEKEKQLPPTNVEKTPDYAEAYEQVELKV